MKWIPLIALMILACQRPENKEAGMLAAKLEQLRSEFIKARTEECSKKIMAELEQLADSVLIYEAKKIKYDSLTIPYDSIRPEKPDIEFPDYKIPVKPGKEIKN